MTDRLPPGQRALDRFPRFGLTQFARRFPRELDGARLTIAGEVDAEIAVPVTLDGLPRVEQTSDFHCVTTWSRRGLRWSGVRFADFHEQVVLRDARPDAAATQLIVRGQDGARTSLMLEDTLQPDVLLADTLDGRPLEVDHGAPLRLVAPSQYGYKSVKHVSRIEYRRDLSTFRPAAFRFMDHPRARVELEERGRIFPGWLLRLAYRPLVGPTIRRFDRAMRERNG